MANSVNWGLIRDGATLQSLVNTIVSFKYPHARLFGRPGKDGAQDARAENIVFQAKFREIGTKPETLISEMKSEWKKIEKYKISGHKNEPLWQGVDKWILVTNLPFNANNVNDWQVQVVPQFANAGLDASEYWGREKLEALLTEYPEIYRAYFEAENRVFLSLPEAWKVLRERELGEHGLDLDIYGREQEFQQVDAFLESDKKVLPIHGPGGIGKSRLLFGIGLRALEQGWQQVFWANVETMAQGNRWYEAIIPERKTLMLIDEPTQPEIIKVILEQLSTSRLAQWKVIIATRTSNDLVLNILRSPRLKLLAAELPLKPLAKADSEIFALKLLQAGRFNNHPIAEELESIATNIAKQFDGFPIWIAVAVNLLEQKGDLATLPHDISQLAKDYFEEILKFHEEHIASKTELEAIIRWVALYERIHIEDDNLMEFLESLPGFPKKSQIIRCLSPLVKRGFLTARGVNKRLHEIKPDVMRDYVLREWLTLPIENDTSQRRPSGEAKELTDLIVNGHPGKPLPRIEIVLKSLARAELLEKLSGSPVPLLDPIIEALREKALNGSTLDQLNVINLLPYLSFARIRDTIEIIKILRTTPKSPENQVLALFDPRTLTHDNVIEKLAWQLFLVAQYVSEAGERQQIIQEMCQLILAESALPEEFHKKFGNDGKRAQSLLPRIITGGLEFLTNYSMEAFEEGKHQIKQLCSSVSMDNGIFDLLKALLLPQLAIERMDVHADENGICVCKYIIPLKGNLGQNRDKLRTKLRQMVATQKMAEETKILAWELLSAAHISALRARPVENVKRTKLEDEEVLLKADLEVDLENDLEWTRDLLKSQQQLSIKELKSARTLWDWHYQFESVPGLKQLAVECEQIYRRHPLPSMFHYLFDHNLNENEAALYKQKQQEFISHLTNVKDSAKLFEFVKQAIEFLGPQEESKFYSSGIADTLGNALPQNQAIKEFVFKALSYDSAMPEFKLAAITANVWLKALRNTENQLAQLAQTLSQLINIPQTNRDKQPLLLYFYGRQPPQTVGILTSFDLDLVESHLEVFSEVEDKWMLFQILGSLYYVNWERFTDLVEQAWKTIPVKRRVIGFGNLFDTIHFIDLFRNSLPAPLTREQVNWLINQILLVPDIDEIGRGLELQIQELVKRVVGKLPLSWLVEALQQRIQLGAQFETENSDVKFKIVPTMNLELAQLVRPIDADSAKEPRTPEIIKTLLELNERRDSIGYVLPKYAIQIDPDGFLVPGIIADKLSALGNTSSRELIWLWSRYAGYYLTYSKSWRNIAIPACQLADKLSERERSKIYSSLESQVKYRTIPAGEFDTYYEDQVALAKHALDAEKTDELIKYHEWKIQVAQAKYERALAEYEEEQEE